MNRLDLPVCALFTHSLNYFPFLTVYQQKKKNYRKKYDTTKPTFISLWNIYHERNTKVKKKIIDFPGNTKSVCHSMKEKKRYRNHRIFLLKFGITKVWNASKINFDATKKKENKLLLEFPVSVRVMSPLFKSLWWKGTVLFNQAQNKSFKNVWMHVKNELCLCFIHSFTRSRSN